MEHKVTKIISPSGKERFLYWYKVTYKGGQPILFMWTILDRIVSGRFAFPTIFPMENGKSYEFTMLSDEMPVWAEGKASMMQKIDSAWGLEKELQEYGITISHYDFYALSPGGGFGGPLPPSLLKPLSK